MELRRHHFYILIAVMLLIGLMKISKGHEPHLETDSRLRAALNTIDEKPYTRPSNDNETLDADDGRAFAPPKVHFPESNTFSHPPTSAPAAPAKVAATDKDKKKETRKKKKKDNSIPLPPIQNLEDAKTNPKPLPSPATLIGNNNTAPQQPESPAKAPETPAGPSAFAKAAQTLEEWQKNLLTQPSATETAAFVKAYKSGQVPASTFYAILKSMITDSRQEMKLLGISAAGQVQSVQSFNLLASVLSTPGESTQATQAAQTQLNAYASVANLSILETVLRTNSTSSAGVEATNLLATLATQLGQASNTSGGATTAAQYKSTFSGFVNLLNRLSSSGANAQLATSAKSALDAINKLLAPSTTLG